MCGIYAIFLAPTPAAPDTVKLFGKPAFRAVTITGFDGAQLAFEGLTRETLRAPLTTIQWVESTRFPLLGTAERNRTAAPDRAADAYDELLGASLPPWLARFARVRALQAFDESGHFDRAVVAYVRLLLEAEDLAGYQPPRRPGPPGSPANQRALDWLRRLRAAEGLRQTPTVARLLLELVIYEEAELPDEFAIADDPVAAEADTDEPDAGGEGELLFGGAPPAAPVGPAGDDTPDTTLPLESYVFAAARRAFEAGEHERTVRLLQRALVFVQREDDRPWQFLLGRALFETGRYSEAAARLTRLIEAGDMPETSAESLYYVGLANERLKRSEAARRMYARLLERSGVSDALRAKAREALTRVGE